MKWKRLVTLSMKWNCEVRAMNTVFNFGLYREGLKKIRIVGIVAAVLCIVISALIPLTSMMSYNAHGEIIPSAISVTNMAIPLLMILAFTPIFVFMMFSFLNKRSESDFFHSIPYRRESVYLSFMAAVITWAWGIVLVTLMVSGILWSVHPCYVFVIGDLVRLGIVYFLLTAFLAGIMAVAMTLTGTGATNLFIFVLIAGFVRVLGYLTVTCLDRLNPIFDISYSAGAFLTPDYSLLYGLIQATSESGYYTAKLFANTAVFAYTAILAVLLISLGCLLYKFRRSEMAGKSAPNHVLQHVYRCAITLPVVLLVVVELMISIEDGTLIFVTIVAALLVYFLYELITTKKLKNCLKATPYLGVLLVAGALFAGSMFLVSHGVLNENISADEIQSVAYYKYDSRGNYYENIDYSSYMTKNISIDDEHALNIVASALRESELAVKNGEFYGGTNYIQYKYKHIEITLKSGKKIGRYIRMTPDQYYELNRRFEISDTYAKAIITLPEDDQILNVTLSQVDYEDVQDLWDLFRQEYDTLSIEQKLQLMTMPQGHVGFQLSIYSDHGYYSMWINLTDLTPQTMKRYIENIGKLYNDVSTAIPVLTNLMDKNWWYTESITNVKMRIALGKETQIFVEGMEYDDKIHFAYRENEKFYNFEEFKEIAEFFVDEEFPDEYSRYYVCLDLSYFGESQNNYEVSTVGGSIYHTYLTQEQYNHLLNILEKWRYKY